MASRVEPAVMEGSRSAMLDKAFFNLFKKDDMFKVMETLHRRYYDACKVLDFRLYYYPRPYVCFLIAMECLGHE